MQRRRGVACTCKGADAASACTCKRADAASACVGCVKLLVERHARVVLSQLEVHSSLVCACTLAAYRPGRVGVWEVCCSLQQQTSRHRPPQCPQTKLAVLVDLSFWALKCNHTARPLR